MNVERKRRRTAAVALVRAEGLVRSRMALSAVGMTLVGRRTLTPRTAGTRSPHALHALRRA
ncbi:hypothetical protein [Streptomyces reniochalinae]|uniref:hypothetical protein n=1 Tax=Streptomyces reniochalinae TaxID=2250578 RepID=UPI0011C04EF0|nr:hypothetical protein [Streptomyces reniochalinae]